MKKNKKKEILFAYSWSAPSLILILLIVIFPILYTGYISLTNMNVYHWNNYELIGLKNYKDALLVLDNGFIQAFLVTILWTIVNMVLQLIIAFLLANLLNLKRLRLRNLYKILLIFPGQCRAMYPFFCGKQECLTPSLACSISGWQSTTSGR